MNNAWKEWFVFTRKERTGILVLVTLILFTTCLPWFFSAYFPKVDKNLTKEIQAEILHLSEKLDSAGKSSGDDRYLSHYDVPADKKPAMLFEFDPNTLSADGWRKLGVRDRSIQTIRKYLAKGGSFRQPADLKKIYGLRQGEAEQLMPYVRIKNANESRQYKEYKKPEDGSENNNRGFEGRGYPKYKKLEPRMVDINTADSTAFIALPGIGSKLAKRIISFRDKLGGFHSIGQLKETYGITDSTFDKIRPLLQCAPGGLRTLDVNKADFNSLSQHPYIGRNLANAIVRYRQQHGPYGSLKDLQKIVLITPEIFEKIVLYLAVQE